MKNWIRAAAVLLVLCCAPAHAHESKSAAHKIHFDKAAAQRDYDDWYGRFLANIRTLAQDVHAGKKPDQAQINKIFADSLVPDSRMVIFLTRAAKHPENFGGSHTDPPVIGWVSLMMILLDHAVPAGQGGPYKSQKMLPSDKDGFVWYITLHTDSSISEVFQDKDIFKSYHVPPDGVLERDAYPFMILRREHGKLYCISASMELGKVVNAVWKMQLE